MGHHHPVPDSRRSGTLAQFRRQISLGRKRFRKDFGDFALHRVQGGLTPWFSQQRLPGWKMVLTVLLGLYPTVMLITLVIVPRLGVLPFSLTMLIGNVISVVALQWLLMPPLNRILDFWLKPAVLIGGRGNLVGTLGVLGAILGLLALFLAAGSSRLTRRASTSWRGMMSDNGGIHDPGAGVAILLEPGQNERRGNGRAGGDGLPLPRAVQAKIAAYSSRLTFLLNGQPLEIENPDPAVVLSDYIRDSGLTGTKVGCGQGGCGACTVMISHRTPEGHDHRAINSCLRPLAAVADSHVTTVEGIGDVHDGLDPVQERIALCNGTQCGFCTPGFVMNAHVFLRNHPSPTQQQMEDLFGGNLCRCTGYRPILHAMRSFARDHEPAIDPNPRCEADPCYPVPVRSAPRAICLDGLPDPDAPLQGLYFHRTNLHWFRPPTLAEAHELKAMLARQFGADRVRLVVGHTARAIYPGEDAVCLIDLSRIRELNAVGCDADGLRVGAAVPIERLIELAETAIAQESAERVVGLRELTRHAKFLAGVQVRSAGSVGGNIAITKSHTRRGEPFPSDLFTVLAALGASVIVRSDDFAGRARQFTLDGLPPLEDLPNDAMFVDFHIPWTRPGEHVRTFRVARRPQMAHPIVNAGFRCLLDAQGRGVSGEVTVVFGGLASCNGRMPRTEQALTGRRWDSDTLRKALAVLEEEVDAVMVPMEGEGFTSEYRCRLALGFFYKFYIHVAKRICPQEIDPANLSARPTPANVHCRRDGNSSQSPRGPERSRGRSSSALPSPRPAARSAIRTMSLYRITAVTAWWCSAAARTPGSSSIRPSISSRLCCAIDSPASRRSSPRTMSPALGRSASEGTTPSFSREK